MRHGLVVRHRGLPPACAQPTLDWSTTRCRAGLSRRCSAAPGVP
ncbi:hypothetical protein [Ornithinimicrobium kibberense]